MLLMPLHGAVVAQHHLPQCLAKICQARNVAVQSDVLPTESLKNKVTGTVYIYKMLFFFCIILFHVLLPELYLSIHDAADGECLNICNKPSNAAF